MHYENVKKVSLCYATRKALSTSANQWELRLFMFSRFQVILWWCNPSNRDHKGKECIPAEDKNHTFAKQNHNAFTFTRNRDAETAGVSLTKQDSPFQHFSQDSCFSFVSFVKTAIIEICYVTSAFLRSHFSSECCCVSHSPVLKWAARFQVSGSQGLWRDSAFCTCIHL